MTGTNGQGSEDHQIPSSVLDAVRRFADASRTMAFTTWAAHEMQLALKEADAAAQRSHNAAFEAHLEETQDAGSDQPMGFTAAPDTNPAENASRTSRAAEMSRLAYGQAEAAAKLAEVQAERAEWELELAEADLLDAARSVPATETAEQVERNR